MCQVLWVKLLHKEYVDSRQGGVQYQNMPVEAEIHEHKHWGIPQWLMNLIKPPIMTLVLQKAPNEEINLLEILAIGEEYRDRKIAPAIAREVDLEVARYYYGAGATTRDVIVELGNATKEGRNPKPWCLPNRAEIEQKWGVVGVLGINVDEWGNPSGFVTAGGGKSVLVVSDDRKTTSMVNNSFPPTQDLMDLLKSDSGYAGVIRVRDFENMIINQDGLEILRRCDHVLLGGFVDDETPCRLMRDWYHLNGWGSGAEEAAELLLSLTSKQALDIKNWGKYWLVR